ncbi:hypothetical protein M407DRAFT_11350 [Tulasnella calospora MUT 4182]|uniref:Uncharacterized protein n=1 Tax=Tulasnella calospora MUT 4182 TaxID=1051891 RepID=A0A0C3KDM1_9AGAM|nr:hypothetical protein M407DRAFT_11350 [Tulasnella calospora MUT 4182]
MDHGSGFLRSHLSGPGSGASPSTGYAHHDNGIAFAEDHFAGVSPSSTLLVETTDLLHRVPALALTFECFSGSAPYGAEVFQSTPEGFTAGDVPSSSSMDAKGLQLLLDLLSGLGKCDAQACGTELCQRSLPPQCSSLSSESGSNAFSQDPAPLSPALDRPATLRVANPHIASIRNATSSNKND